MQSVEGLNNYLECADCKRTFTSASLLLKHFADHINEAEIENFCKNASELSQCKNPSLPLLQTKKKVKKESILETVLRLSAVQCKINGAPPPTNFLNDSMFNSNTSSSDSFKSSACHITNAMKFDKDRTNTTLSNTMVVEIGQRAKEKKFSGDTSIVKFDLQKRLEKCVSKLQALKHSKEIKQNSNLANCNVLKEPDSVQNSEASSGGHEVLDRKEAEDLNPSKLCTITLQEKEENLVFNSSAEKSEKRFLKGASNRKQLKPKKIHRPQEDPKIEKFKSDVLTLTEAKACQRTTGKRKYLCHVCSKSFGWSTDLKRHILTHTGERPFKCQMCDATFTRNFLLQKHESRVHSLNNTDNKHSQDEDREQSQSASNNNSVEIKLNINNVGKEKVKGLRKCYQKKGSKATRTSNGFVNSCNVNSDQIKELCSKLSPAKRKLQGEESSFDHFPQKVFNIL